MMTMRIGLVGAHRVGKTTLAKALAEELDIKYFDAGVRTVFEKLGINPQENLDFYKRSFVQEEILTHVKQQTKEQAGNMFISDRTPIDVAAYYLADIQRATATDEMASAAMSRYIDQCVKVTAELYDAIILVRPGIPLVACETSAGTCTAYQSHIDMLCHSMFMDLKSTQQAKPSWAEAGKRTLFRELKMLPLQERINDVKFMLRWTISDKQHEENQQ